MSRERYPLHYREAAERHYHDGIGLQQHKRFSNAGYHFGFAAECALKASLHDLGLRYGRDGVMQHHFPDLLEATLALQGRVGAPWLTLLRTPRFLAGWRIRLRYSKSKAVKSTEAELWRSDACNSLALL